MDISENEEAENSETEDTQEDCISSNICVRFASAAFVTDD